MTINQITVYNILSWLAFLIKNSYIFELGESAWLKQCAAIKRGNLFFFISISIRLIKIGIGTLDILFGQVSTFPKDSATFVYWLGGV